MKNYQQISMDDIIFEGRNKQYGAYELRQKIDRHSSIGLMATISAFTAILIIYSYNPFREKSMAPPEVIVEHYLSDIKEILPPNVIPPKTIEQAAAPLVNTLDNREMQAVVDQVAQTIAPVTQTEAFDSHLGTETVTNGVDKPYVEPIETTNSTGNVVAEVKTPVATNTIITYADVMPSYNGGKDAMMDYLKNNIKPFQSDVENGGKGKVILRFYVDTDGTVRNPEVVKDNIGGRCAEAAINAVKKMKKWNPGKQNGIPVKVYFTLPVTFDFTKS